MSIRLLLCGMLTLACLGPAAAQGTPAAPRPSPSPSASPTPYQVTGVEVNRSPIKPGEALSTLLGAAGPPDHVDPVRGKEVANDYVRFTYSSYGLIVHVKSVANRDNVVESLVILQNNVKLLNVPFRVGDDYKSVMKAWGQPDQQEPGFMAYWKRGVYVSVADTGVITGITLAEPGHVDDPAPTQPKQPPPSPSPTQQHGE